jgi:hypothetical protein
MHYNRVYSQFKRSKYIGIRNKAELEKKLLSPIQRCNQTLDARVTSRPASVRRTVPKPPAASHL